MRFLRSPRPSARLVACALSLLPAFGCGYALVGRGVAVDPSIKRLGVPLFKDRTGKPGLDQKLTQAVTEELLKRRRFEVVPAAEGVDALVDVELLGYNVTPVGFGDVSDATQTLTQATRYAIIVTARVRYAKVGAEQPLWVNDSFTFRDEYDVGDAANFFDREEQAIDRLAESFARSLVAAMLEAF